MKPRDARLRSRPGDAPRRAEAPAPATHALTLPQGDGLIHVPAGVATGRPAPLVVAFHGAGGDPGQTIPMLVEQAELHDLLVLAPKSRGATWDIIGGGYGPDIDYLDAALTRVFGWFSVASLAAAGFSDGASYALSVGLANGGLFSDVLAFSPGFAAPDPLQGSPRVFMSHGSDDRVLPIARTGRPVAERLTRAGYDVDYREFAGGHVAPPGLVDAAIARFLS